jgi:hypothetical protein
MHAKLGQGLLTIKIAYYELKSRDNSPFSGDDWAKANDFELDFVIANIGVTEKNAIAARSEIAESKKVKIDDQFVEFCVHRSTAFK